MDIQRLIEIGSYRGPAAPPQPARARPAHEDQRAHAPRRAEDGRRTSSYSGEEVEAFGAAACPLEIVTRYWEDRWAEEEELQRGHARVANAGPYRSQGIHQRHLQQYDRVDDRHRTAMCWVGRAPARPASRARARARPTPRSWRRRRCCAWPAEHGVREVDVLREGARSRSRGRGADLPGLRDSRYGRYPTLRRAAQRLPAARRSAASRRGSDGRRHHSGGRMGRYIDPVCKLCRREGQKLFLKGERCYTAKCARRATAVRAG